MKKHLTALTFVAFATSSSPIAASDLCAYCHHEWYLLAGDRGCELATEVARISHVPGVSSPGQWQDTIHGDVKILRDEAGNILRAEITGGDDRHAFFYTTLEMCLQDKAKLENATRLENAKRSELY